MKKLLILWVVLGIAVTLSTQLFAQEASHENMAKKDTGKEVRVEGLVARTSKDQSMLTVREHGSNVEKDVHYDSSTKWTHLNKPAEMSEFKDGADVICLGTYDEKGVLHASRIDLRRE